jgi:hypothetical protein
MAELYRPHVAAGDAPEMIAAAVPTYTLRGAMTALRCSRSHIYHLADQGKLRLGKIGGRTVVRGVEDLIEAAFADADGPTQKRGAA